LALEVFPQSNFIELYPTDKDIWAVNSMRQLQVSKDFKKGTGQGLLQFTPVNDAFNVMRAGIGSKHQVAVKIVKQLDELMVRDPNLKLQTNEANSDGRYPSMDEVDFPIP
jgi:hypothetical protein